MGNVHYRDMALLPATVLSPELAKPGLQTPVLTELTVQQRQEAGGSRNSSEGTHGSMVVSSLKKQEWPARRPALSLKQAGSLQTKNRGSAPKNGLCRQPLLVEAGLEAPPLEVTHSGEPHIKAPASF